MAISTPPSGDFAQPPTDREQLVPRNVDVSHKYDADRQHALTELETAIVHVDGAYYSESESAAVGVIIEDNRGNVLFEITAPVDVQKSTHAESAAAMVAVQQVRRLLDLSYLVLYSDCQPVVRKLSGECPPRNNPFIRPTRAKLDAFEFLTVKHIPRENNTDAHQLASNGSRPTLSPTQP